MRFNLVYGNHGKLPIHIEDVLRYLRCGLSSAGHFVQYNSGFARDSCNLLLEAFTSNSAAVVEDAARLGYQFVVIVSEVVTGLTFNNYTGLPDPETNDLADHYNHHRRWKKRFDAFVRVAGCSRAIWCLADVQVEGYRELLGDQPVSLIPMQWLAGFPTVQHQPNVFKNIDFLFTGVLSPRRSEVLAALRATGANVIGMPNSTPAYLRDEVIGRSKVCLNILQTREWQHYSNFRFYYHVMNRSYIASERALIPTQMASYVDIAEPIDFAELCLGVLADQTFVTRAEHMYERFRDETSGRALFEELVASSL